MLQITIKSSEKFNESTNEFIIVPEQTLQLEHSLVSLSKWESKWNKPFISKDEKSIEETIDYIKCMTITKNVKPEVYYGITNDIIDMVNNYIEAPMTATWFSENKNQPPSREVITSEIIYYWMISLNIPMECQRWHLNRLLALIKVCNIKNTPPKKMSKKELMNRNRSLNEARKLAMGSNG